MNKNKLRAAIVGCGYTQKDVADKIGISSKTFSLKLKKGVFGTDEVGRIIELLRMSKKQANDIFFEDYIFLTK